MPRTVLAETQVAGMKHYQGQYHLENESIKSGVKLIPILEPNNKHDEYAVELHARLSDGSTVKMGYIPATLSRIVHILLENEIPMAITILKSSDGKSGRPFMGIRIALDPQ